MKFCIPLMLSIPLINAVPVSATDYGATLATDYVTEYIFRGATFAGNAVQPGLQLSFGDFNLGAWASLPIGAEASTFADEVNLFAGYTWHLSDKLNLTTGAIVYHFPQSGNLFDFGTNPGDASTLELYGNFEFQTVLSPTLATYYDIDLKSFSGVGSISHDYHLTASSHFTVDAEVGLLDSETGTSYEWGKVSGSMNWKFTDTVSAYAKVNWAINSEKLFIDTNFDPNDASTVGPAKDTNTWFSLGLQTRF